MHLAILLVVRDIGLQMACSRLAGVHTQRRCLPLRTCTTIQAEYVMQALVHHVHDSSFPNTLAYHTV